MTGAQKLHRGRGTPLLALHCASLEPETPSARTRLDVAVGSELAWKLVFALCTPAPPPRSGRL